MEGAGQLKQDEGGEDGKRRREGNRKARNKMISCCFFLMLHVDF